VLEGKVKGGSEWLEIGEGEMRRKHDGRRGKELGRSQSRAGSIGSSDGGVIIRPDAVGSLDMDGSRGDHLGNKMGILGAVDLIGGCPCCSTSVAARELSRTKGSWRNSTREEDQGCECQCTSNTQQEDDDDQACNCKSECSTCQEEEDDQECDCKCDCEVDCVKEIKPVVKSKKVVKEESRRSVPRAAVGNPAGADVRKGETRITLEMKGAPSCSHKNIDGSLCGCGGVLHRSALPRTQYSIERFSDCCSESSDSSDVHVTVDDIKEAFPTQIPRDVGVELTHPSWVVSAAPYFVFINFFLMFVCVSLFAIPLALAIIFHHASPAVQLFGVITSALCFILVIPFWTLIWYWHPCIPFAATNFPLRTVDVVITTFKEDLEIVLGTIEACQRINYDPGYVKVYLLDDGKRSELEQACLELNSSPRCKHPITYVTRPTNRGRKGGNINHWIREFDDFASEFFIVLDADMQPFPEMLNTLFGHYYGFQEKERERIAFIQAPQHFRNHLHREDVFEVGMTFFNKVILPCMDRLGIVMYVGTCALWRRQALISGGGFHEKHATEDSVTGCKVHRTKIGEGEISCHTQWISKLCLKPVAVGISPSTLPDLIDQRLRWCLGSVEMFFEHSLFLGARELSFVQRMSYFCSSGYWVTGLFTFLLNLTETTTLLTYVILSGILAPDGPSVPFYCFFLPVLAFPFYFTFLPVASLTEKLRAIQMFGTYTPVYILSLMRFCGIPIKIQSTATDSQGIKRWHDLFYFHILSLFFVVALCVSALFLGAHTLSNICIVVVHLIYWMVLFYPVFRALTGHAAKNRY